MTANTFVNSRSASRHGDEADGDGDSEPSTSNDASSPPSPLSPSQSKRRKIFRKSRKKSQNSLSSPGLNARRNSESDEDAHEENKKLVSPKRLKKKRNCAFKSGQSIGASTKFGGSLISLPNAAKEQFVPKHALSDNSETRLTRVIQQLRRDFASSKVQNKFLATAQSTPATPLIRALGGVTPESRRNSSDTRPQLLAMCNGSVSVEPRVRRSLSQGSLVQGHSASLFGAKTLIRRERVGISGSPKKNHCDSDMANKTTVQTRNARAVSSTRSNTGTSSMILEDKPNHMKSEKKVSGPPTNHYNKIASSPVKKMPAGQNSQENQSTGAKKTIITNQIKIKNA